MATTPSVLARRSETPTIAAAAQVVPSGLPGADAQQAESDNLLDAVDKLKFFLATAPGGFDQTPFDPNDSSAREQRALNRFTLPTGELISCVLWNGLYHITGTDIVRALNFRFLAFGRPVKNAKKFEEGIFSDLRNLKSGTDATLEDPKVSCTTSASTDCAEKVARRANFWNCSSSTIAFERRRSKKSSTGSQYLTIGFSWTRWIAI